MMNEKNEVILNKNQSKEVQEEGLENVIILTRPVTVEDVTYTEITLDFENLTGEDIEKAEMQFNAENPQNAIVMVKEMAKGFAAIVAAKAAGVHVSVIRKLSASDYSKVTMRTTLFLMGGK